MAEASAPPLSSTAPWERLLAALPPKLSVPGARVLRRILTEEGRYAGLASDQDGHIQGLDDAGWQFLWGKLVQAAPSYGTRRRYRQLLLEAAAAWKAAGLIAELPDLRVPAQHRRRLSVPVHCLKGFRFSDLQTLKQAFTGQLLGQGRSLVPAGLRENFLAWVVVGLILGGFCVTGPIGRLVEWTWGDLPPDPHRPLRLPARGRRGAHWMWLLCLPRLLLLALQFRARPRDADEPIFASIEKLLSSDGRAGLLAADGAVSAASLGKAARALLAQLCDLAGLPVATPGQLIAFVRLDLRQVLSDLQVMLLAGLVHSPTVPADQVRPMLDELLARENAPQPLEPRGAPANGSAAQTAPAHRPAATQSPIRQPPPELTALLGAYEHWLGQLALYIEAAFEPRPSRGAVATLRQWSQVVPTVYKPPANLPRFNLAWLVRWLLELLSDRGLRPSTRERYWAAALMVLRAAPACPLNELEQGDFEELVDGGQLGPLSKVTRAAWTRLQAFLKECGLAVAEIDWQPLMTEPVWQPVRALSAAEQSAVRRKVAGQPLALAIWLARRSTLREGEVCRLLIEDVQLARRPYLIVHHSKGGRSRRLPLEHLSPSEHKRLFDRLQRQVAAGRRHVVTDAGGAPLQPRDLSEAMRAEFAATRLRDPGLEGRLPRFHDWRAQAAEALYREQGDVRPVALAVGHVLPSTTVEHYLRTLDLQAVVAMQRWRSPLNDPAAMMPVPVLAALLDVTTERVAQVIAEFNRIQPAETLPVVGQGALADSVRPKRPGKPANYVAVRDTIRLVSWLVVGRQKRGSRSALPVQLGTAIRPVRAPAAHALDGRR